MPFDDNMAPGGFQGQQTFLGKVTGYRFFRPYKNGILESYSAHTAWTPGVNTAKCLMNPDNPEHKVPVEGCWCGFWIFLGFPSRIKLWEARKNIPLRGKDLVFGMVSAYGGVIPGDKGYRAQFAQILATYVDPTQIHMDGMRPAHMERIRAMYGIPVFSDYDDFTAFCREMEEPVDPPGPPEMGGVR